MSTLLRCRAGTSDKAYRVTLETTLGGGWGVKATWGPSKDPNRSSVTKFQGASYKKAREIFIKLLEEKVKKSGYHVESVETPKPAPTTSAEIVKPAGKPVLDAMRCAALAIDDLAQVIADPSWRAEPRMRGKRLIVDVRREEAPKAWDEDGVETEMPAATRGAAMYLGATQGDMRLDGVLDGETLRVFDILERNGVDLRDWALEDRIEILDAIAFEGQDAIGRTEIAETSEAKAALVARGGVVFKKMGSRYGYAGRPETLPWREIVPARRTKSTVAGIDQRTAQTR